MQTSGAGNVAFQIPQLDPAPEGSHPIADERYCDWEGAGIVFVQSDIGCVAAPHGVVGLAGVLA
jgi:hypothetical protein